MSAAEPVALTRLRCTATGILAALVAVFLVTLTVSAPPGWVLFIRAVAEAGMVGGLADWFAVEAIFRHPLRIPIPHTALLRTRKDDAADNIGRFIKEYILVPGQISENVARVDPAARLAEWLQNRENARYMADLLGEALSTVAEKGSQRFNEAARILVRDLLKESRRNTALSALLTQVLQKGASGRGFDQVLTQVSDYIGANRSAVSGIVRDNSRWWVASRIDDAVADLIVDGVVGLLADLSKRDTDLRNRFEATFREFVSDLDRKGATVELIVGDTDADVDALADHICAAGGEILRALLLKQGADAPLRNALTRSLTGLGDMLANDEDVARVLNERVVGLVGDLSDAHRDAIGGYVADTLKSWDADVLIERIEAEVGADLQFIRINGAILVGCIGGVIFALEHLIGA